MPDLTSFFYPKSIAVVGASERDTSMGGIVLKNLRSAGYEHPVYAINLKGHSEVFGYPGYSYMREVPAAIDLAIVCVPATAISRVLRQMGRLNIRAAMILTGGLARQLSQTDAQNKKIRHLAKDLGIRVFGPNCLGILVPDHHLNASYTHIGALPGHAAYVGHSAAVGVSLLDWATARGIGFSHFVTLGASADIRISDVVDYLASDRRVKAILVHLEQIRDSNRLLIALRAAARSKKVLAIRTHPKSRVPDGLIDFQKIDEEYFSRAGVLQVETLDGLFAGLEVLSRAKPVYRRNLAIVSNGLGTAMLARQYAQRHLGELAPVSLTPELKAISWYDRETDGNPLVIPPQSSGEDYVQVLKQFEKQNDVGVVLLVHSPNLRSDSYSFSQQVLPYLKKSRRLILTCFLGGVSIAKARAAFDGAGLLSFDSLSDAVDAYLTLAKYQAAQERLRETPRTGELGFVPDVRKAKSLMYHARQGGRQFLTWPESRSLLRLYGFNLVESLFDVDFDRLLRHVTPRYFPAALRIVHEQYSFPFAYQYVSAARWRGAKIEIPDITALKKAHSELIEEKNRRLPDSKVLGFSVQPMRRKVDAMQFSIGITRDETYGPMIFFGEGGSHADMLADRQVSLAPINSALAYQMIERSHGYQVLLERSNDLTEDLEHLTLLLITLSQMVIDLPRLRGLEINLLLQNHERPLVLGVAVSQGEKMRPALNPYPVELVENVSLKGGAQATIRPIKGEDEPLLQAFFSKFDTEALRLRFFYSRIRFEHLELATMCQIDYKREMVFIAEDYQGMIGEMRLFYDINKNQLEFAIMVAPEAQGTGLASALMQKTFVYAKQVGALSVVADVLPENGSMLGLAAHFGFEVFQEEDIMRVEKLVN